MKKDILESFGFDYETGIDRCMGDEEIYCQLLSMFLEDDTFFRTQNAYNIKDYDAMFRCAHELKGISGNASITGLYNSVCIIVEVLRNGQSANIDNLFSAVEREYSKAVNGVNLALE